MPVPAPTDAIPALLLLHVPPVVVLLSVVAEPTHTAAVPVMAAGSALIVTVTVLAQPVPNV